MASTMPAAELGWAAETIRAALSMFSSLAPLSKNPSINGLFETPRSLTGGVQPNKSQR